MAAAEDELAIRRANREKAEPSKAEAYEKLQRKISHFQTQLGRLNHDLSEMQSLAALLKPQS